MTTYSKLLLFLFFTLLLSGCRKDVSSGSTLSTGHPQLYSGVLIETDIVGRVLASSGSGYANVEVTIGNSTTTTSNHGIFSFTNIMVDSKRVLIKAERSGYNTCWRAINPTSSINKVEMVLFFNPTIGSLDAQIGGTVITNDGLEITIPENAVVDSNNDFYIGIVDVAAILIDPNDSSERNGMPGDLTAISEANEIVMLRSAIMADIRLTSESGESLQLAEGQTSLVRMPINEGIQASAPETIELWHFDESMGVWIQEGGSATLEGNAYVAELPHFSLWNCDMFNESASLEMCFEMNNESFGITDFSLVMEIEGFLSGTGNPDYHGCIQTFVPANETIDITFLDPCGNEVFNTSIGPFSPMTNNEITEEIIISESSTTIQGIAQNCDGEILANENYFIQGSGATIISYGITNDDGSFTANLLCDNEFTNLFIVSYGSFVHFPWEIVSGVNNDIGTVQLCSSSEYCNFLIYFNGVGGSHVAYPLTYPELQLTDTCTNFISEDFYLNMPHIEGVGFYPGMCNYESELTFMNNGSPLIFDDLTLDVIEYPTAGNPFIKATIEGLVHVETDYPSIFRITYRKEI